MKQVVIMPGGFHPFHAGHYALYKQAQDAFPGADVYVAATNDTSARPFPFAVKEKLAKLAGVNPGKFIQVKSPFRAMEIVGNMDPATTQLIFVRSSKDADKPPQAGGVKKNGEPSYLQPLAGNEDSLLPMNQRAYMAYLPTVEFGPGMTSATEIRTAWPRLNEKRKTALVMSLYPKTQTNPALAATVVKMLDAAIGTGLNEGEVVQFPKKHRGDISNMHTCPKCGGDTQGGKYQGHEVQVCMPCKQVYLPPNSGIDQQGNKIKEAGFDREEFRRHMKDLEAREALRKTDPVSAKALDLRGELPQQSKKKPEDDSIGINDPRHPGYAYTQAGQHKLDEFAPDGFDGFEDDNRVPMHFVVEKELYNRRSKWKKSRDADGVILFATKQQAIQAAEKFNKLDPNREFAYGGTQMVHVDDDLNEFAKPEDNRPEAEYEVYLLDPKALRNKKLSIMGEPMLRTDNLAQACTLIYKFWNKTKHPICVWQPSKGFFRDYYMDPAVNWMDEYGNEKSELNEFAPDEGGGSRKFIPWPEFIEQVKQLTSKDFSCKENIVKSTIKARFVPHDPMEFGPTMLYSYYETRAGGRNKGAISTRGSIQVGKYTKGGLFGHTPDQLLTGFHLLKGHPFERHFDLTFDNIYKIANIILGNTEGALEFKPEQVTEGTIERKINRLQQMVQSYHDRARATKNDIKKQHYTDMANQLAGELDNLIGDYNEHERAGNEIARHDEEPSKIWEQGEAGPVEAYGYVYDRRDQRVMWRKTFPSEQAAKQWADSKNATVLGTKSVQQTIDEDYIDEKY